LKIVFVLNIAFKPTAGGVQRTTWILGEYFTKQKHTVFFYTFVQNGHEKECPSYIISAPHKGRLENLEHFKKFMLQTQPEVVINQMPYDQKLREALAKLGASFNFKLIGCIHNSLFPFKNNVKDIMRRVLPEPFNQIMATETMSKIVLLHHKIKHRSDLISIIKTHDTTLLFTPANYEELKYFLKEEDFDRTRIDFMPNPVEGVQQKVPNKEKVILHVGRINIKQKRSDLLLDFWEKIYKELPEWQFKIVGNGSYLDTLKEDLKKRGLVRVELLGFQKPEKYYKEASIFMMPSAYEGFPNTILESHSFGCPILAFNSYAALECIVDDGKNALLAKPYDTSEMAKLCVDLAKNDKALAQMQKAALVNAERFSIDKIGKQWLDLFDEMV
jgi:glycosyltransferase involved in cell wall biosynthesis